MTKNLRKLLYEVIQESVDAVYYIEEDTINTAKTVLDQVLKDTIRDLCVDLIIEIEQSNSSSTSSDELCTVDEEGATVRNEVRQSISPHLSS